MQCDGRVHASHVKIRIDRRKLEAQMKSLMRVALVAFLVSLGVWGLIAVWNQVRIYDLLLTWQRIAVAVATVSGLAMLSLFVDAAWERLKK
jgi:hypothetical protein